MSRPPIDHSRTLRRTVTAGKTLDEALAQLRADGASILDCIASVRAFRRCELSEAKRVVEASAAWTDVCERTEESLRELTEMRATTHNHCVRAAPGWALREFLSQVSGAPDAARSVHANE